MAVASMKIRLRPSARRIGKAIGDSTKDLTDFKPAFRQMLPILARGIKANVTQQGATTGEKWAPLSPRRIAQKRAKGLPMATLQASGGLLSELSNERAMKRSLTKTKLVVGPKNRLPYMIHFGDKDRGVEGRRFIVMSSKMRKAAFRILVEYNAREVAHLTSRIRNIGGVDS